MRASLGIPHGPKARLYNPRLFQNHEEVIVYEREEFRRTYNHIRENIKQIIMTDLCLDPDDQWQLMGHWPLIMERIHFINKGLDSFFSETQKQCYLDTYLESTTQVSVDEVLESWSNQPVEELSLDWL